jgi:hypothetical protein
VAWAHINCKRGRVGAAKDNLTVRWARKAYGSRVCEVAGLPSLSRRVRAPLIVYSAVLFAMQAMRDRAQPNHPKLTELRAGSGEFKGLELVLACALGVGLDELVELETGE